MAILQLTRGMQALVDDEDFGRISAHRWQFNRRTGYAQRTVRDGAGGRHTVYLHREVLGAPAGLEVDHINPDDRLDCRKVNLRLCTRQQNLANTRVRSFTGYKGVTPHPKRSGWWIARIKVNGKSLHIGVFDGLETAARAYDDQAVEHFGEFARLNFPGS